MLMSRYIDRERFIYIYIYRERERERERERLIHLPHVGHVLNLIHIRFPNMY